MRHLAAIFALFAVASSPAWAADFQPPQLRPPERGSLVGEYSAVAFKATELDRGVFRLPGPFELPDERGAAAVNFFPDYSSHAGISEYGVGWQSGLEVHRFRASGDLDYATDDRSGPWGQLVRGRDGYWYPLGMSSRVRVQETDTSLIAYLPDGSQWTFGGAAAVHTSKGIYAWYLTDVVTATGRRTHLSWVAARGRFYLDSVQYGGVAVDYQYRVSFTYESTPSLFVSYASGEEALLDRRVQTAVVAAKNAVTGAWAERWRYTFGYQVDAWGPAFYLTDIKQTFISGESPPAAHYSYNSAIDWLEQASFAPAPLVQPVLQQFGADALQHDRSTLLDTDDDGRVDLESASTQTLARMTDAGYVFEPLPAPGAGRFGGCRPDPSPYNVPRNLMKLYATDKEYHVVDLEPDGGLANTAIYVCGRDGTLQAQQTVVGDWAPGPLARIADLNRDSAPDLIQVGNGYFAVLPNISDATGIRFDSPRYGMLSPAFQPVASWVYDFNGDGLPDLIARDSSNVVVWFGLGSFNFTSEGQVYGLNSDAGWLSSLDGYDVEFLDANHDGLTDLLLSQAGSFYLYINDGFAFQARAIPAMLGLGAGDGQPVFADLSGSGNAELAVSRQGSAYTMALDQPGTGLMASADDGKGTVLHFSYARAPANPRAYQRPVVLSGVTAESSGYDSVSYAYAYAGARTHSAGHFLLGFDQVTRRDPTATVTQSFLNEDDFAGVELDGTQADRLTPDVLSFDSLQYSAQTFQGIRWMRPSFARHGYQDAGAAHTVEERTDYLAFDADFCPATTRHSDMHGTLTTQTTRAQLPANSTFAQSLHCLAATVVETGQHADSKLDFRHEDHVELNAVGLPTAISKVGTAGTLLVERIAYNPDWTIASLYSPATGTSTYSWNTAAHVLSQVVAFDGTIATVSDRSPVTDAILQLVTAHGALSQSQWFRYDGQERLAKSWDNLGHASETKPNSLVTYRYATKTQPGSIRAGTLVDGLTGSAKQTVELFAGTGEGITSAQLAPEGWLFDRVTTRARARAETNSLVRSGLSPNTDPTQLDYPTLFGGTQALDTTHSSSLGIAADALTRFHSDVARSIQGLLSLTNGALTHVEVENGAQSTTDALDAGRRTIGYDDQAKTHWGYVYDALGRLRAVQLPDGTKHRIELDDYGRRRRIVRDGVASIEDVYEPQTGRLSRETFYSPDGAAIRAVGYAYDHAGRRSVETNFDLTSSATGTFRYYYDGAAPENPNAATTPGLLTAVSGDGYVKRFAYRADGKLIRRTTELTGWRTIETTLGYADDGETRGVTTVVRGADGKTLSTSDLQNGFDGYGRIGNVRLNGGPLASLGYDKNGQLQSAQFASGDVAAYSYDSLTRIPVGFSQAARGWTAMDAYRRDARGFIGGETLGIGAQSVARNYTYSPSGFLAASTDPRTTYGYGYDAAGLPVSIGENGNVRKAQRSGNTLTVGTVTYQMDGLGRTVSRGDLELTYGPSGQVERARRGANEWTFKYDEAGQRILKLGNGAPIAGYPTEGYLDNTGLTQLLPFGKSVVGVIRSGAFQLVPLDRMGSVLGETDGTQKLASPYGDRHEHTALAAAIEYVQKGYDADLDLVRMGVRDYDPQIGRFLTPDPLFLADPERCVKRPIDCNLYSYAGDSPAVNVDPDGLQAAEALAETAVETAGTAAKAGPILRLVPPAAETLFPQLGAALVIGAGIGTGLIYQNWTEPGMGLPSQPTDGGVPLETTNPAQQPTPTPKLQPNPLEDQQRRKDGPPRLVYRNGSKSNGNMTPREGDDTVGPKRGLSTFDRLDKAAKPGQKAQVIDLNKLRTLETHRTPDGHVSIRPPSDATLKAWAATREATVPHPLTIEVQNAIVDTVRRAK